MYMYLTEMKKNSVNADILEAQGILIFLLLICSFSEGYRLIEFRASIDGHTGSYYRED